MHFGRLLRFPRTLIVVVCVLAGAMLTAVPASAAPLVHQSATSGRQTFSLSIATCAKLKAALPQYANDARLCTVTHVWSAVTKTPSTLGAYTSCPTGSESFYDYDYSDLDLWEMDLNTSFQWNGNCGAPALTKRQCYVAFTISTSITDQKCWWYNTNLPSTAAVYQGQVTEDGIVSFPSSQRRECYEPYNDCGWTQWDGW